MKTTYSNETSLVFIFRFSDLNAANIFWEDFDKGNLKTDMKTKLQSFLDKNNCFSDGTVQFDNVIDPDDFAKVRHTLQNPKEGKWRTGNGVVCTDKTVTRQKRGKSMRGNRKKV